MHLKKQQKNPIVINYHGNKLDQQTKDAVKSTVVDFKQKLPKDNNFLNGCNFEVVDEYKNLENTSIFTKFVKDNAADFKYTGGCTISPVIIDKEEIIIKTGTIGIKSVWRDNVPKEQVSHATMHEIGHRFDEHYGSCSENLKQKVRNISDADVIKETPQSEKILTDFSNVKDLSDSKSFKEVFKKDLEAMQNGGIKSWLFRNYSAPEYGTLEIDISDGVTNEEVDSADNSRCEVFAQLFSYAMKEDDGNKDSITKNYPKSYQMVKLYIRKHLGINP